MNPLTNSEVRAILATLSYKPGWEWQVDLDSEFGPRALFTVPITDTYTGKKCVFIHSANVPWFYSKERVIQWFRWQILEMEQHEMDEWIKEDGDPEPVFNPHNPERNYAFRLQQQFKVAEKRLGDKVKARMP